MSTYGLLQTAKVFNWSAITWEPTAETIVVLAPHMDDEVIGCGGTMAKHVARGANVTVVFLTDGWRGGICPNGSTAAADLKEARRHEAQLALQSLGISKFLFLDADDGNLRSTPTLVAKLRESLLRIRPALVYLPFFLEEHPDHRAVSQILLDATHDSDLQFVCFGYEVWTPLFPNCLVRIDETVEKKREALGHYRSQLAQADHIHSQLGLNAYRSGALLDRSCRYAEAFYALPLEDYASLYHAYLTASPVMPQPVPLVAAVGNLFRRGSP